jgi:hypothetical protein
MWGLVDLVRIEMLSSGCPGDAVVSDGLNSELRLLLTLSAKNAA